MRFFKTWFMIPIIVCGLILSGTTTIHASSSAVLYTNAPTNTYKASFLKDIEKIIQEAMRNRQNTVVIQYKGSTDQLLDVISGYIGKAIENDEYLNYSCRSVNVAYKAYGTDITITLKFTYYESAAEMKYVDQQVKAILAKIIKPEMNNHEKVKAVHDYLVLNLGYDTTLNSNSPYTALKKGVTACNGYAMLAYKMLKELGFEVRLISGVASSQVYKTQNHAWNLVKLDDKWYHLDVTWDDPVPDESGRVFYDYYLLTDKEISKNHSWKQGGINGEEKPYPASTTAYLDLLQSKLSSTNEAERYQELMETIGLQYMLPEYTAGRLIELSDMIDNQFAGYKNEFNLRYIDNKGDLNANLRQIIYDNAIKNKVKSWSFVTFPYIRGTTSFDQMVMISDIVYQK
ncbi:MAG TPA: Ig domain-containing protein [Bacillales bacterium]|nr:Ig domain-containing protein [Bacillales bacterium]